MARGNDVVSARIENATVTDSEMGFVKKHSFYPIEENTNPESVHLPIIEGNHVGPEPPVMSPLSSFILLSHTHAMHVADVCACYCFREPCAKGVELLGWHRTFGVFPVARTNLKIVTRLRSSLSKFDSKLTRAHFL